MPPHHPIARHILRHGQLLRLQPRAHNLVWVGGDRGGHFSDRGAKEDGGVRERIFWGGGGVGGGEELEVLVERKLDGDVEDSQEARDEPAIECAQAFDAVDGQCCVEGVSVPDLFSRLRLSTHTEDETTER